MPIPRSVDTRPLAQNHPRPQYTEEARANNTQGQVQARVLVGADGLVKEVIIIRGLPDGLNEAAVSALRKSKFKPATLGGVDVPYWLALEVEFNLR